MMKYKEKSALTVGAAKTENQRTTINSIPKKQGESQWL